MQPIRIIFFSNKELYVLNPKRLRGLIIRIFGGGGGPVPRKMP